MALKVTSLGDIFRTNVKNQFEHPTIWIDCNGETHYDNTKKIIANVQLSYLKEDPNTLYLNQADHSDFKENIQTKYKIATLVQIGSHVEECYGYCNGYYNDFGPDNSKQRLIDLFKYAYNLKIVDFSSSSSFFGSLTEIPEDLFWICPNLETCRSLFSFASIKKIPSRLFEKSVKLIDIEGLFLCCDIQELPEDLFKNNLELRHFRGCFSSNELKEIPDNLFKPFLEIPDCKLNLSNCFVTDSNPKCSRKLYDDLVKLGGYEDYLDMFNIVFNRQYGISTESGKTVLFSNEHPNGIELENDGTKNN